MAGKVLLVRNTPYDANPNTYNIQEIGIGKAFCRLGYDYEHICFKRKNQRSWVFYKANGHEARYTEVPRWRFLRWGINLSLCKRSFLEKYDIVISREYYQIMTYLMARNAKNVSMYNGPYYNMFMIKFFSFIYDFLFTRSLDNNLKGKFVKSELSKQFLEKKGYSDVVDVCVGLDTERFDSEEVVPDSVTMDIVSFMKSHECILYVGALSDRKNYPFLLETYQKILEKKPNVRFVVIGKSKISALGKLFGFDDNVYAANVEKRFPQSVRQGILHIDEIDNPQLKFIYPLAKAFLLPSKLEIFGMVLLEAMYLKAPVITSFNGGAVSLIKNYGTGKIISEFNSVIWANAVCNYLDNPNEVEIMVAKAHNLVKTQFTWDAIAKRMLDKLGYGY